MTPMMLLVTPVDTGMKTLIGMWSIRTIQDSTFTPRPGDKPVPVATARDVKTTEPLMTPGPNVVVEPVVTSTITFLDGKTMVIKESFDSFPALNR